ncbi:MAG: 2-oxoacid:acceptor oxidoreductase subunit alpha [Candidatus Binatia bacterium]|jgi:2-oxoglutarate/2-oxoacid ferredoxin oxidoreductase subunit alpha
MHADPSGVLTGQHYLDGNHAACEGALAAGCRFAAGYPITPSTEIVERAAARFPFMGGMFIQMEDEIAASIAIQGAVWAGKKAMTVTSGPGFSLMMEHIGLAAITETPCVFFNVQRGGPSTGLPTLPGQADMMQARWGSHGDYEIIALSPQSPQECFNIAIDAFNLAEQWRVPVLVMMDECVGHMTERVIIPKAETIAVTERRWTKKKPSDYKPFEAGPDLVPDMAKAGDGYHLFVTGLTHDERGYPVMNWQAQEKLVHRLVNKIRLSTEKIIRFEEEDIEGADVVVVSYGITARVARRGAELARQKGVKVGMLRLVVVWPFPEKRILELASKVQALVVPEMNYGQMVLEVERAAHGKTNVVCVPHGGGEVHDPEVIAEAIIRAAKQRS